MFLLALLTRNGNARVHLREAVLIYGDCFGWLWFGHFVFLKFASASRVQMDILLSAAPCSWSMAAGLCLLSNLRTFSRPSWTPWALYCSGYPAGQSTGRQPAVAMHFMAWAAFFSVKRGPLDWNINPTHISLAMLTQAIGIAVNSLRKDDKSST